MPCSIGAALGVLVLLAACGDAPQAAAVAAGAAEAARPRVAAHASKSISPNLADPHSAGRPATPVPGYTLIGTTLADGASFAIVQRAGDVGYLKVRFGDRIDQKFVTSIAADHIELMAPGEASDGSALYVIRAR